MRWRRRSTATPLASSYSFSPGGRGLGRRVSASGAAGTIERGVVVMTEAEVDCRKGPAFRINPNGGVRDPCVHGVQASSRSDRLHVSPRPVRARGSVSIRLVWRSGRFLHPPVRFPHRHTRQFGCLGFGNRFLARAQNVRGTNRLGSSPSLSYGSSYGGLATRNNRSC